MIQLADHFASDGRSRHSEWLRQRQWFIKARHDQQRRDEIADRAENGATAFATAVAMATPIQIVEFKARLNSYDAATVTALMENQKQLDAVVARIDAMLAQAHVLDDGRRVFKTEDGKRVFDEFGTAVTQEEVDPVAISDDRPTWEAYSADMATKQELTEERTQILEFQERVDAAREEIAGGDISEADLAELDADLMEAMPTAVRAHVPGLEAVQPAATTPTPAAAAPARTQSAEASTPAPAPFQ